MHSGMDIFALKAGDAIKVFLIGKGVEAESLDAEKYPVTMQMMEFIAAGEKFLHVGRVLSSEMPGRRISVLSQGLRTCTRSSEKAKG
jgi:hypothetical protein